MRVVSIQLLVHSSASMNHLRLHPTHGIASSCVVLLSDSLAGPLGDVLVDLQAVLHEEGVTSPAASSDCETLLHGSRNDAKNTSSSFEALEYGVASETASTASSPAQTAATCDPKPKESRRGRRTEPNEVAEDHDDGSGGRSRASESAVNSVATAASVTAVSSASHDAVTADPASQVVVTDENADDADCSSSVMHRDYAMHVRRVILENMSLVIGSNLTVFQVRLRKVVCHCTPLSLLSLLPQTTIFHGLKPQTHRFPDAVPFQFG